MTKKRFGAIGLGSGIGMLAGVQPIYNVSSIPKADLYYIQDDSFDLDDEGFDSDMDGVQNQKKSANQKNQQIKKNRSHQKSKSNSKYNLLALQRNVELPFGGIFHRLYS